MGKPVAGSLGGAGFSRLSMGMLILGDFGDAVLRLACINTRHGIAFLCSARMTLWHWLVLVWLLAPTAGGCRCNGVDEYDFYEPRGARGEGSGQELSWHLREHGAVLERAA